MAAPSGRVDDLLHEWGARISQLERQASVRDRAHAALARAHADALEARDRARADALEAHAHALAAHAHALAARDDAHAVVVEALQGQINALSERCREQELTIRRGPSPPSSTSSSSSSGGSPLVVSREGGNAPVDVAVRAADLLAAVVVAYPGGGPADPVDGEPDEDQLF
jgi:hypothetical protein